MSTTDEKLRKVLEMGFEYDDGVTTHLDLDALSTDEQGRPLTRVRVKVGRPQVGAQPEWDFTLELSVPDYETEDKDAVLATLFETMAQVLRAPKRDMLDGETL